MRKFWRAVFCICLVIFLCCCGTFVYDFFQSRQSHSIVTDYTNPTQATTAELRENPINFEKIKEQNKDIFSWIRIKNTNIDYPILSPNGKSDDYYLRRNIKEEYDRQGVIYIENCNSTDWSDPVTLIYGHNIWTMGTMFYQLHSFSDKDFFNKNKYIEIYAPGRILTYEIYSAFEYDDRHIMNSFNFEDDKIYSDFIDYTLNPISLNKNVRNGVNVTTDDNIIVLSTCIKTKEEMRYLVVGVLVKDENTK